MSAGAPVASRPSVWLELFEEHVSRRPDAPALESGELTLSYAELDRWAGEIAAELSELAGASAPLVGVYVTRGPLAIAAIIGVLKAGRAYIALDPSYPRERIEHMVTDAALAVVLGEEGSEVPVPTRTAVLRLAEGGRRRPGSTRSQGGAAAATDPAYVVYTSGSTGRPKGSLIIHAGLANMALAQRRVFGLGEGDRVLQFSSLSFDASTFELILALGAGACLCLADTAALQPGEPLQETLEQRAITTLVIPPSALAKVPLRPLPELRTLAVAGEPCPARLVEAWGPGRRMFNLYGPSEATIWTTQALCSPGDPPPPIGRAIDGVSVQVLDEGLDPVGEGEVGELHIGGAGVSRGYLKRARLTAERFIPDRLGEEGRCLYRSGDLVRRGPGGDLQFVGRRDRQVKVRGYRIDLGEVEAALLRDDSLRQVAVVQDPEDRRLVGYLVPAGERSVDIPQLRELARRELPGYMVPGRFIPVPEIPLDPNRKADLRALPRLASRDLASATEYTAPVTAVETVVATLMAQALRFDLVGRGDDMFRLGGDSLQAPGVVSALEVIFGCRVPFESFVARPTPRAVAALIESAADDGEGAASAWLERRPAAGEEQAPREKKQTNEVKEDAMNGGGGSEEPVFTVVRSCHGHYSIWPQGREVPPGWTEAGREGSRKECLDFIESTWEDPVLGFLPRARG
jgi:amino acid adenylation domain-containing protein